jgi:hypothetical protein
LPAKGSARNNTEPDRVTDSYRPGQRQDENKNFLGDQPMQDTSEIENPPKRRRAIDGDFYRPSLRPRPLPSYEPPPESDAAFRNNFAALGRKRSPKPPTQPRPTLQRGERKQNRLARIQGNIKRAQKHLAGHWISDQLRLETERLLAGYQADLKAWNDRDSKDDPQRRYNTARLYERKHALKLLDKARSTAASLQGSLNTNYSRLQDVLAMVSDDEEEGGVMLTEASADENRDNGASEKHSPVQSTKSSRRRRAYIRHPKLLPDPACIKLRGSELQKALAEAQQKVQIAEVDANYCCFAPLDQPYICLFPTDEHGRIFGGNKNAGKETGRPGADPEKELQKDTEAGILRTKLGDKPPLWIEIEEKMKAGSFQGLADTLGLGVDEYHLTEVGGKVDALERAMVGSTLKRRHSWMDDDEIAPEDLDSESESESESDDDEES